MAETILSHPIFTEIILPFVLVFTIVFAILQRTKVLGEDKKQIDAIVAAVVGLLLVAFAYPTGVITKLVPFLAVGLVVIFVFLLLYGFMAADKDGLKLHKGIVITGGIIIVIALIVAVLWATGSLDQLKIWFSGSGGTQIWANVILVVAIIGAIATVLATTKSKD